jgi:hypothetical protein
MRSRQYVAHDATGCSAKGQTIASSDWWWSLYLFDIGPRKEYARAF